MSESAIAYLNQIVGPERVVTDIDALAYFGSDLSGPGAHSPALVVRPAHVDDVCRVVKILTDLGIAVIARGGGFSSSGGVHVHKTPSAVIDLSDLNRIVEINETDRYVTVEAGCTWGTLFDALRALGLRTPFFGPASGLNSTIGGAAGNNAYFFGSGRYGTMADCVLGLDVVLADGSLVETGSAAAEGRTPFLRSFGPDFTGIFLGDCGAFGIKVAVTLPLIPYPAAEGYLSFAFERCEDIADAHVALARENVVDAARKKSGGDRDKCGD